MMDIFFSVVIPTYNRANLILETLDSIFAQTFQNFEVIIVDDGSTDNTEAVLKGKYAGHTKLRYYFKENEERGAARNYGIRHARGDYVVIFDSDDIMHSDYLLTLWEGLTSLKETPVNFIATKYHLKEESGKILPGGSSGLKEGFYNYKCLLQGNCFGCMYAIKRDNPNLKLFSEDRQYATLEDWMFIFENLRYDRIYLIDKVSISVRHGDFRSTADNQKVINVRDLATGWLLKNIELDNAERRELLAWSHYYKAIHYYLDHDRRAALNETLSALKKDGMNSLFILMLIKSLVGKKFINIFR